MEPDTPTSWKAGPHSVMRLAWCWQCRVAAHSHVVPRAHLSPKELGQLRELRRIVGDDTMNVIDWAVNNWSKFAWEARERTGLCSHPENPHIGFLLRHCDTAVNMMSKVVPEQVARVIELWDSARSEG